MLEPSGPNFAPHPKLIHDLQIEIEEFGEDFVFLGVWKVENPAQKTLTGFIFQEDLSKAELQGDERIESMRAADILTQLLRQKEVDYEQTN